MRIFPGRKRKNVVANLRRGLTVVKKIGRSRMPIRVLSRQGDNARGLGKMPLAARWLLQGVEWLLDTAPSGATNPLAISLRVRSRRSLWGRSFSLNLRLRG